MEVGCLLRLACGCLYICYLMSGRSTGQASIRPETDAKTKRAAMSCERNSSNRADGNRTKFSGTCRFKLLPARSELSPGRYLKHLGDKMVAVLHFLSSRKKSSTKVSSSGTPKPPAVAPIDSQRAEAINDCIQFINSSSSLTRSNSVSC